MPGKTPGLLRSSAGIFYPTDARMIFPLDNFAGLFIRVRIQHCETKQPPADLPVAATVQGDMLCALRKAIYQGRERA
jgi:hypothetical protein